MEPLYIVFILFINNIDIASVFFLAICRNVDAALSKFPAISGTASIIFPFFSFLSLSRPRNVHEFPTLFSTTSPSARMLNALLASERAIVGRSDTILPWRASSVAAAADRREILESLRSFRVATRSSPWVDRRGGSSSSVFAPRHAARLAVRFLRIEDSPRDAEKAAAVSSAAPDESSPPGSCISLRLQNFPRREIGNPKYKKRVRQRYYIGNFLS